MDLVQIFRILRKRLWLLILVPLITASITFFILRDAKEKYRSSTQVATGITIKDQVQLNEERFTVWEADLKFTNLIETFKSPGVVNLLSYRLILHDLEKPDAFRNMKDNEDFQQYFTEKDLQQAAGLFRKKLDSLEVLNSSNPQDRKLIDILKFYGYDYNTLINEIGIKRVNYSDYLGIEYVSENPQLSAFVVNTYVEEFQRFQENMQGERSGQSLQFFATLAAEKKQALDEKRNLLRSYQEDSRLLNVEVESDAKLGQIAALEQEKQAEESRLSGLEITLRNINRQLNQYKNNNAGSARNTRIVELQNEIDRLNQRYISTGMRNQQLQDSINVLRSQMRDEYAKVDYGQYGSQEKLVQLEEQRVQTATDIDVARGRIRSLDNQLARLNFAKSDIGDKKSSIEAMRREVELAQEEYAYAQEKYNAAKNVSLVNTGDVRQVTYGQPAIDPEPSKLWIFTGLAAAVSLFLCLVVVLMIEYIDLSIRTPQNLEKNTRLPIAGTLNQINAAKLDLYDLFHNTHKEEGLETFKHLLRKLRYEMEETGKQIFLFTSTKQGEGKSFVIMTLAYSLSLLHKRVLIIDTNFKHNTLTQNLLAKPQNTKLLNGYMANGKLLLTEGSGQRETNAHTAAAATTEATAESDHYSFISPTHHTNIDIIGSHVTIASPAEILSGKGFSSLMEELKHHYDYIFLEGASLNDYSDTKELIRYAEKVVSVFSASSVLKQLDKDSIRYLKELNGNLMGAIVNKVEHKDLKL